MYFNAEFFFYINTSYLCTRNAFYQENYHYGDDTFYLVNLPYDFQSEKLPGDL